MNTSYEKVSFFNNYFGGIIDGNNIYTTDFYGNKQLIGVTTKKHQETVDLLDTYYNKLIELGVIEKEKTPDEIAKEQQQMMQAMMNQMAEMQHTIQTLQSQKLINEDKNDECRTNDSIDFKNDEFKSNTGKQFNKVNRKGEGGAQYSSKSN